MVKQDQGLANRLHLKQHLIYPADLQAALTMSSSSSISTDNQQAYSIVSSPISSRFILSSFISGSPTKLVARPGHELAPLAPLSSSLGLGRASASLAAAVTVAAAAAAAATVTTPTLPTSSSSSSSSSTTTTTTSTLVATSSNPAPHRSAICKASAAPDTDLKADCHAKNAFATKPEVSSGAIVLTSSSTTTTAEATSQKSTTTTTTTTTIATTSTKNVDQVASSRATSMPPRPEDRSRGATKRAASGIGLARFNNVSKNSSNTIGHTVTARLMDLGKRLLSASREGDTDTVKHLVVNSGAPFTSDWLGTTALHLASQNGHFEVVKILLRAGVNKDAKTKLDRTPLHFASQGGSLEIVDLLLVYGSNVNARDMLKMTPLHWAAERHHTTVAERLVAYGADLEAKSKFRLTPLDIAEKYSYFDIVNLLGNFRIKKARLERPSALVCSSIKSDPIGGGLLNNNNNSNHNQQQRGAKLNQSNKLCLEVAECTESRDFSDDSDYKLVLGDCANSARISSSSTFDIDSPCIDLVELEWSTLKFEPDFFLSNDGVQDEEDTAETGTDEPTVGCLVKIVEELQRENMQLRQKVEQLSTK